MTARQKAPDCVVVVVPAHNEESRLPGTLEALLAAQRRCALPVELIVVLDACTDGSAGSLPPEARRICVAHKNVGASRAQGFRAARASSGGSAWYATTDPDPQTRLRWEKTYRRGRLHVHGANLGFREDVYWRAGGFRDLSSGEDVGLVGRFVELGVRIRWAEDIPVATSGRLVGRAPEGFASDLAQLADDPGEKSAS